ncbi:hypothetical protein CEXT_971 [Caerostris extrusa]|uniref:Secreted protein n=1 Tax=Caerostris extrusa TaxID=172846 RepID=A0AAV4TP73_CAEEX|nr:hypothetical protein CEXT_971 [Caerostris extrusa]
MFLLQAGKASVWFSSVQVICLIAIHFSIRVPVHFQLSRYSLAATWQRRSGNQRKPRRRFALAHGRPQLLFRDVINLFPTYVFIHCISFRTPIHTKTSIT